MFCHSYPSYAKIQGLFIPLSFQACQEYDPQYEWIDISGYKDKKFGACILIPVIIAFLFTIPHWMKVENTWKKRLYTMPLLIGQVWPQFQFIKVLWAMRQSNVLWKYEREKLDKQIGSLGMSSFFSPKSGVSEIWKFFV